jgi:hypothetical protein
MQESPAIIVKELITQLIQDKHYDVVTHKMLERESNNPVFGDSNVECINIMPSHNNKTKRRRLRAKNADRVLAKLEKRTLKSRIQYAARKVNQQLNQ